MDEVQLKPTPTKGSVQFKDLLIPLSIVIAGLLVGTGLYLSGGPSTTVPTPLAIQDKQQPEAVDTTNKIDPVTQEDHIKGNLSAPVKIVEYSDFECPFCKRHHETLKEVVKTAGEDKVAWVFRQFPLEQLHPVKAMAAAMASECVGELGGNDAFWAFTDGYFAETLTNNRTDIETLIPKLVTDAGVNQQAFNECFESNRHQAAINADLTDATETGGRGTPWSIIIGPTGKTYPVNGAQPAAALQQMIDFAISDA